MDEATLRRFTRDWPGVSAEIKWEDDLVFMVGGKMFACLGAKGKDAGRLSFKVEDDRFLELTDRPGFRPAPYMARAHWVTLDDPALLAKDEVAALVRRAYELVFARLTKKLQRELGG